MKNNTIKHNNDDFRPAFSYDFLTPYYDSLTEIVGFGKRLKTKVVKLADIKLNEKILDVGAGTGTFLIEVKREYPSTDITGVDSDEKILEIAERKLRRAHSEAKLVQSYAQKLPFKNSSFDLVVSTLTFHHLSTEIKKQAVSEIYRVLRKGGRFLLADFGKPGSFMSFVLLQIGSVFDGREEMRANLRGELPGILKQSGFSVQKIGKRYLGIEFLLARK